MNNEELKQLLSYDSETGTIIWKVSPSGSVRAGSVAGNLQSNGYIYIRVSEKQYLAHRLAWLLHHGVGPTDQIDHINGIRTDNRICNLREATSSNNKHNCGKRAANTSGFKGVTEQAGNWKAQCMVNGKNHYLGLHSTPEAAHQAYCDFAAEHHGKFFHA